MSIFSAPSFYNQADQNIYREGFSFIPQEKFRGGAFNFPTSATTTGAATGINTVPINMGGGGGGGYFENLRPEDQRGFLGNFQDINPNEMYSYTPQGITIEDLTKNRDGDFAITAAPSLEDQSGYIKPAPEIFEPKQPNMFQKVFNPIKDQGARVFGGLLSVASGVPFLGEGLQAITNQFENRPLGAAVIDEFGNVYDEDELNKMNALGGYYTDPARSALQDENRDRNRGGYQSSFASKGNESFMEGDPTAGGKATTATMGSFMDGGLVDLVDIYD